MVTSVTASIYAWSLGIQWQKQFCSTSLRRSRLSSIAFCQQSRNSALPANKCSCLCKDQQIWDGGRWTQSRLHLSSWKTPLPHMQIPITQLKKSPLSTRDTSPASAAWQSSAHYQQPVLSLSPKWPVQTQVLPQSASVSHGREYLTLHQHCTLKSAHYCNHYCNQQAGPWVKKDALTHSALWEKHKTQNQLSSTPHTLVFTYTLISSKKSVFHPACCCQDTQSCSWLPFFMIIVST